MTIDTLTLISLALTIALIFALISFITVVILNKKLTKAKDEVENFNLNLETSIQDEATARANADTTLQGNINTLSNTVTSNYNTLDAKIDNTKTAIDGDISDLSDTVSANYTDLSGQISDLSGTVESYNEACDLLAKGKLFEKRI